MESKARILNAAVQIFAEKGFHGARIENIGAEAGINKAMVYYYYSNKKNLFQEALNMIVGQIYSEVDLGIHSEDSPVDNPEQTLEKFIRVHFSAFSKKKEWAKLYIDVLNNRPEYIRKAYLNAFASENIHEHTLLEKVFTAGVGKGIFRDLDFKQVFISIFGMNIIYFLAGPIAEIILNLNVQDEKAFLKERENTIVDLVLHGLLKR
ncbi:TetR/AcrR family transcriptional regulator [Desulfobacter sp.]|uniref:TetR/AcrR family transcriptional regulator n=1 Tax=Desulfobacter sp. TaxID=2294 RepID=UPI003D0C216C